MTTAQERRPVEWSLILALLFGPILAVVGGGSFADAIGLIVMISANPQVFWVWWGMLPVVTPMVLAILAGLFVEQCLNSSHSPGGHVDRPMSRAGFLCMTLLYMAYHSAASAALKYLAFVSLVRHNRGTSESFWALASVPEALGTLSGDTPLGWALEGLVFTGAVNLFLFFTLVLPAEMNWNWWGTPTPSVTRNRLPRLDNPHAAHRGFSISAACFVILGMGLALCGWQRFGSFSLASLGVGGASIWAAWLISLTNGFSDPSAEDLAHESHRRFSFTAGVLILVGIAHALYDWHQIGRVGTEPLLWGIPVCFCVGVAWLVSMTSDFKRK